MAFEERGDTLILTTFRRLTHFNTIVPVFMMVGGRYGLLLHLSVSPVSLESSLFSRRRERRYLVRSSCSGVWPSLYPRSEERNQIKLVGIDIHFTKTYP